MKTTLLWTQKRAKRDLVFEQGKTTTLLKIRDMFYPGRNVQMITKAMQLRVPGMFQFCYQGFRLF